ncbi:MAG: class II aldolase/adducin family protein [Proteobacteria bacterium]|nr:class II aldolase/adducin family protein [Pseudomonadota bacterium]
MTGQIVRMPSIRQIDPDDALAQLRQELLFAFHVVDMLGQPSGMGSHLTARLPGAETFLFHVHNFGFGEVTPDLIHEADFELNVLSGEDVDVNPTLHIHTQIYAARPDVTCILHTHAKHVTALSALGENIQTITQGGARIHDECVLFDEDDGVALGKEPGAAMARALGGRSCMVLKNHGLLAAATSVPAAVILADTMEKEAEMLLMAMAAGRLSPPSAEGSQRTKEYLFNDKMFGRGWTFLLRQLARQKPDVMNM